MMLPKSLIDKITAIFEVQNERFYEYLWVAEIFAYYECPILIAACVKTRNNPLKGLILIVPNFPSPDYTFYGTDPIRYVTLDDWTDPVHKAVQSMSLLPAGEDTFWLDDSGSSDYYFKLNTYNAKFAANLSYGPGHVQHDSLVNLWAALRQAIKSIAEVYQDEAIRDCVKSKWE
jgi:hypothetical protein